MKFLTISCYLVLISSVLFAAHPLTTDDIGIVDGGKYELEIGYDNCKSEDELRNHSCGFSLKHGITEKMDVGISFPYQVEPRPAEQLGRVTLGFKFLLIEDIFAFSVSNELGSKEYFVNSIVSREFSPMTVHLNFGYLATGDKDNQGEIIYSSAFEYPLRKIDLVGETIGKKDGLQNWLLGLRYKVSDVSALNFAYGNGFRETNEKTVFGFHTEF